MLPDEDDDESINYSQVLQIGQIVDINNLKRALKLYSLRNNCPYFIRNSEPSRFHAKCSNKKCSFNVIAYERNINIGLKITSLCLQHSIFCVHHKKATSHGIMHEAKQYVPCFTLVKPRDMMNTIRTKYGVQSTYMTAWRGLKNYENNNIISNNQSFMLISSFMDMLKINNPGTITSLEINNVTSTFERAFICPRSNQLAFPYCRPIVILDACHIKSLYGGIILSACSHDGEGRIVPLAVGVAEVENEFTWTYFLENLVKAIPSIDNVGIVVMHDREKGLHNAHQNILPNSHESICVYHLEKNVNYNFKSKFKGKIWAAAKAYKNIDFEKTIEEISKLNLNAAIYLINSNPVTWARSKFPVP